MIAWALHIALLGGSVVAQDAPLTCPSVSDMQLLTSLHQRRLQLDTREAALMEREKTIQALRDTLDQRLAAVGSELEKFEARYKLGEPARQARETRVRALVEAMTGLSAKKAAPILAAAAPELTGDLLMRMGPARSAALLAIMPVQRAAVLMEQMRGPLPGAAAPPAGRPAAPESKNAATAQDGSPQEKSP